jgi:uncharacterized membrane protein YdcZ (DUF606 family)
MLEFVVPKDLLSKASNFAAKNPRKYFICIGTFLIVLGIIDLMTGAFKFDSFGRAALHFVPIIGYILLGIFCILAGIFKIGLSKKSD